MRCTSRTMKSLRGSLAVHAVVSPAGITQQVTFGHGSRSSKHLACTRLLHHPPSERRRRREGLDKIQGMMSPVKMNSQSGSYIKGYLINHAAELHKKQSGSLIVLSYNTYIVICPESMSVHCP